MNNIIYVYTAKNFFFKQNYLNENYLKNLYAKLYDINFKLSIFIKLIVSIKKNNYNSICKNIFIIKLNNFEDLPIIDFNTDETLLIHHRAMCINNYIKFFNIKNDMPLFLSKLNNFLKFLTLQNKTLQKLPFIFFEPVNRFQIKIKN